MVRKIIRHLAKSTRAAGGPAAIMRWLFILAAAAEVLFGNPEKATGLRLLLALWPKRGPGDRER